MAFTMAATVWDYAARAVLEHYPTLLRPHLLTPLGNFGGFSGAHLWRLACDVGHVCLRAWPAWVSADELVTRHELIQRARRAGLTFVPALYTTSRGTTWVAHGGRLWEAASWQSGRADFETNPSTERLRSACVALARLHSVWAAGAITGGKCPAVERRLARAILWRWLVASGWRAPLETGSFDPLQSLARRAWHALELAVPRVASSLATWTTRTLPLQPCLCDVWHDNLLFDGDGLSGLVDYGSVKSDHVAVDIARLLGSLVGDYADGWDEGLEAYRGIRPLSAEEESLAQVLDETGTIIGVVNWLLWLYRDRRSFEDVAGVARRLEALLKRLEKHQP
jgi:Ser/Thr protein kinase RdoA (MazF antagonist)